MRGGIQLLWIVGALVCGSGAEEASCDNSIPDEEDDSCAMLQGGVNVQATIGRHEGHKDFPGIFKHIKNVLSGADSVMKKFDDLKTAVGDFNDDVHADMTALATKVEKLSSQSTGSSLSSIQEAVQGTFGALEEQSRRLTRSLDKLQEAFKGGMGSVLPSSVTDALDNTFDGISNQATGFTNALGDAKQRLSNVNETLVCGRARESLHSVMKQATQLANRVTGLSKHGLSKDIKDAANLLPEVMKQEVDKVLNKASDTADHFVAKITPSLKEISNGVAGAFKGHCSDLHDSGSPSAQVGLACALLVLSALIA